LAIVRPDSDTLVPPATSNTRLDPPPLMVSLSAPSPMMLRFFEIASSPLVSLIVCPARW
jgi:hypothetical protein